MRCPYCGKDDTRVIDSRPVEDNNSIRRRRICDSSKIEGGILRACHKRPVSAAQIKKIVDEIEAEVFERDEKEISSKQIGELVMAKINKLDPVAYVRFASVYREFKDVETFMEELRKVLNSEE